MLNQQNWNCRRIANKSSFCFQNSTSDRGPETAAATSQLENMTCSSLCHHEKNRRPRVINIACVAGGCGTETFAAVTSIHSGHPAMPFVDLAQNAIVVSGSYTLTVNLTVLRRSGRVFNRFSAAATVRRLAGCLSGLPLNGIKFKIRFDDALAWSHTFKKMSSTLRADIEVPSTVMSLSLIIHRRDSVSTSRTPIRSCFVSEWLQPMLAHRSPLLPSCYRKCLSSRSGTLYLHCFLPVCPGNCTEIDTKSRFIDVEGKNKVCSECNVTDCPSDQPVTRSICSVSNSSVIVHLDAIRRHGYYFDVFRTTVAIEDDLALCSSPVIFTVYLDNLQARSRTIKQTGEDLFRFRRRRANATERTPIMQREFVVVVSGADKLILQAKTTSETACNVTVKWQNPRLVKALPPPIFTSCNNACADALNQGRVYLGCFLGVCSGTVTSRSNPPFFTLNYHYDNIYGTGLGIGVNRARVWEQSKSLIQLTDGHEKIRFPFGIGAYPSSSITFDLDAFRAHGYRFNFLVSTMGIDSASGCKSHQVGSVIFRVYFDSAMVFSKEVHNRTTAPTIWYDVGNTARLTLITVKGTSAYSGDLMVCYNAVWARLELLRVTVPGRIPKPSIATPSETMQN